MEILPGWFDSASCAAHPMTVEGYPNRHHAQIFLASVADLGEL
jgi:hypothetical protein